MKSILDEIISNKLHEVSEKKKKRNFLDVIKNPKVGDISVIAEIKLASPAEGKLAEKKDIIKRAIKYEKSSCDAISLVVDKKYFNGDLEYIKRVKNIVALPILAKDFVIDPYQIYEMKSYGADAILLIAKIIPSDKLVLLVNLAKKLNIEPVVEVQNKRELDRAIHTDTKLIAVNARNLTTFVIDIDNACKISKLVPKNFISLGFSGVSNRCDAKRYKEAGARGILVGTSLMKTKNINGLIRELKNL
ncbi:hypothetical protein COV53_07165 [Candidatus Gottesmanbacteria bacterium CG11_big_fil_rev_8_21_14_0_20_37_11]|uniref:indole-3-glycerol-phosphate synthase n=3 Tax=Candidatus Gottesmaniibacteriota TaxID=1752720 RepID=A0A2M7RRK1_9BACT|nr:MAG: hypothetical protein AUJ73_00410 [Candidatus Gottesmanbacteria bacterium CG1_02_37_22]PIP33013.1 MAG: hypothetical protein COX23_01640 [Candidatus Gottesmanbacteria bacterium CG23_combo_of_CG06-09_8_20_14_all_37_19]PIR07653.1 MAG: hypothetical protein COV53_07165 [Candidatus Gottesmanbacteria bacterium CG11_big_fil_rev_8_21_14_0_20_37_11]PIZ02937.1 MAG: hypothetical protein COY59_02140 [Candidatus Gottesmanbacteria bacterium CG_4_10_14_0_8_um_filter_37_24]